MEKVFYFVIMNIKVVEEKRTMLVIAEKLKPLFSFFINELSWLLFMSVDL